MFPHCHLMIQTTIICRGRGDGSDTFIRRSGCFASVEKKLHCALLIEGYLNALRESRLNSFSPARLWES